MEFVNCGKCGLKAEPLEGYDDCMACPTGHMRSPAGDWNAIQFAERQARVNQVSAVIWAANPTGLMELAMSEARRLVEAQDTDAQSEWGLARL